MREHSIGNASIPFIDQADTLPGGLQWCELDFTQKMNRQR